MTHPNFKKIPGPTQKYTYKVEVFYRPSTQQKKIKNPTQKLPPMKQAISFQAGSYNEDVEKIMKTTERYLNKMKPLGYGLFQLSEVINTTNSMRRSKSADRLSQLASGEII